MTGGQGIFCSIEELRQESLRAVGQTLHMRRRAHAQQSGLKRSSIRGRGMEFFESRPYVSGDEVRNIDWKVSARLHGLYTKIFIEEKDRPCYLMVDLGPQMFFASRNCFKSVLAVKIAARLAHAALEGGDQLGAMIFKTRELIECPNMRSRAHLSRLLGMLASASLAGDESLREADFWSIALSRVVNRVKSGALVFIISDFLGFNTAARPWLYKLRKKADIFALSLSDPLEKQMPVVGLVGMRYGEHKIMLDTNNSNLQKKFRVWSETASLERKKILSALAIPEIEFSTADAIDSGLTRLFSGRW